MVGVESHDMSGDLRSGGRRNEEKECQMWRSTTQSRERLKSGNLKGKSLAVSLEQKKGPFPHFEVKPWVWSVCKWVKKYVWLDSVNRSPDIKPFSIDIWETGGGFDFSFWRGNLILFELFCDLFYLIERHSVCVCYISEVENLKNEIL